MLGKPLEAPILLEDRSFALFVHPEVSDIAVLHDVFLLFQAHFTGPLGLRFAARLDEVVEADDLSPDEPLLQIGMNDAGCFPGRGSLRTTYNRRWWKITNANRNEQEAKKIRQYLK